jgi:hypothetical protein
MCVAAHSPFPPRVPLDSTREMRYATCIDMVRCRTEKGATFEWSTHLRAPRAPGPA